MDALWERVYVLAARAHISRRDIHEWLGATPASLRRMTNRTMLKAYAEDLERLAGVLERALDAGFLPRSLVSDVLNDLMAKHDADGADGDK